MKRIQAILMILGMVCVSLGARAEWRYGITLGGNVAEARLSHAEGLELKDGVGFRGGVTFEWQAPNTGFALHGSVLYTRYDVRLADKARMFTPRSFGRNFVEVPLHFVYKMYLFKKLLAPLGYTGPGLMVSVDDKHTPLRQQRLQAGWDVGVGVSVVDFIQVTGGYRFGLGNAVRSLDGCPDARMRSNGWHFAVSMLFDF